MLTMRCGFERCSETLAFLRKAYATVVDYAEDELLHTAHLYQEESHFLVENPAHIDKAFEIAQESNKITHKLITDKNNYQKAKSLVCVAHCHLSKQELDKAEEVATQARA